MVILQIIIRFLLAEVVDLVHNIQIWHFSSTETKSKSCHGSRWRKEWKRLRAADVRQTQSVKDAPQLQFSVIPQKLQRSVASKPYFIFRILKSTCDKEGGDLLTNSTAWENKVFLETYFIKHNTRHYLKGQQCQMKSDTQAWTQRVPADISVKVLPPRAWRCVYFI